MNDIDEKKNNNDKELDIIKEEDEKQKRLNAHKNRFIQYIYITLGVIILDFAFFFFLDPARIVSGGTMGLSILFTPFLHKIWPWFSNSIFLYVVDAISLIIGLIFLGKDFFLKRVSVRCDVRRFRIYRL